MTPRREHYGCQDGAGGPPPAFYTVQVDALDARPGFLTQKIVWDPLAFRNVVTPGNELWYVGLTNTPSLPEQEDKGSFTGTADLTYTAEKMSLTLAGNSTLTLRGAIGFRAFWVQLRVTQGTGGSKTLALKIEDQFAVDKIMKTPSGVPLALSTVAGAVDIVQVYWDGTANAYAWLKGKAFA